jgi:homocysteine S-methyltransferase
VRLTDAGLETVLIFEDGLDLPHFAAFPLVDRDEGRAALRRYYEGFVELARDRDVPLVLSAPTWRANPDWGALVGYEGEDLAAVNGRAVAFTETLAPDGADVAIEACVGPRGGLQPDARHGRGRGRALPRVPAPGAR